MARNKMGVVDRIGAARTAMAPNPYSAEDDCRTLQRAHEIMGDKGRHKAAQKHASTTMANLAKVAGSAKGATTRRR